MRHGDECAEGQRRDKAPDIKVEPNWKIDYKTDPELSWILKDIKSINKCFQKSVTAKI
jgi:hypothetical protein